MYVCNKAWDLKHEDDEDYYDYCFYDYTIQMKEEEKKEFIITNLSKYGAFSEETAKTYKEIGITSTSFINRIMNRLVKDNILVETKNHKYYLKQ